MFQQLTPKDNDRVCQCSENQTRISDPILKELFLVSSKKCQTLSLTVLVLNSSNLSSWAPCFTLTWLCQAPIWAFAFAAVAFALARWLGGLAGRFGSAGFTFGRIGLQSGTVDGKQWTHSGVGSNVEKSKLLVLKHVDFCKLAKTLRSIAPHSGLKAQGIHGPQPQAWLKW